MKGLYYELKKNYLCDDDGEAVAVHLCYDVGNVAVAEVVEVVVAFDVDYNYGYCVVDDVDNYKMYCYVAVDADDEGYCFVNACWVSMLAVVMIVRDTVVVVVGFGIGFVEEVLLLL